MNTHATLAGFILAIDEVNGLDDRVDRRQLLNAFDKFAWKTAPGETLEYVPQRSLRVLATTEFLIVTRGLRTPRPGSPLRRA